MKSDYLKELIVFYTEAIGQADDDPETHEYILSCLDRFYAGDYGEILADDAEANKAKLCDDRGRILARYKAAGKLANDIYIIARFCLADPKDLDNNQIMIFYYDES